MISALRRKKIFPAWHALVYAALFICPAALSDVPSNSAALNFYEEHARNQVVTADDLDGITKYVEAHPADPRARYVAGLMFETRGLENSADEQWEQADRLSPDYVLKTFQFSLKNDSYPPYRVVRHLHRKYPQDPAVLYLLGQLDLARHLYTQAFDVFRQAALGSNPWPGTFTAYSQMLYGQARYQDAARYARLELRGDPHNVAALRTVVISSIKSGDEPSSWAPQLQSLASARPKDGTVQLYYACYLAGKHRDADALAPALVATVAAESQTEDNAAKALCRTLLQRMPADEVASEFEKLAPSANVDLRTTLLRLRVADLYTDLNNHTAAISNLLAASRAGGVLAPRIDFRLSQEYCAQHDNKAALYFAVAASRLRPEDEQFRRQVDMLASKCSNGNNDLAGRIKTALFSWGKS